MTMKARLALTLAGLVLLAASPSAQAAFTATRPTPSFARLTGDGASDTVRISLQGSQLAHDHGADLGFSGATDWDSTLFGIQALSAGSIVVIDPGDGDDTVKLGGLPDPGAFNGSWIVVRDTGGADTLDESDAAGPVTVDLQHRRRVYGTLMTGAHTVPANLSTALGASLFSRVGTSVSGHSIVSGLAGNALAHYIRGPAPVGVNAPVIATNWTPPGLTSFVQDASPLWTLTAAQITNLDDGLVFEGVHSSAYTAGEIRDQLTRIGDLGSASGAYAVAGQAIFGGPGADSLAGGDGPERITGGAGADVIDAGAGEDVVLALDGAPDVIDCGPGSDAAFVDPVDTTSNCELTSAAPPASPPTGTPPPTPGQPGPPAGRAPTTLPPTNPRPSVTRLKISPAAFFAARKGPSVARSTGANVSFSLSVASITTFTVASSRKGVKRKGRCVARKRGAPRRPACTRSVPLKGAFILKSPAGLASLRFTGRLNKRTLAPGAYTLLASPRARLGGRTGSTVKVAFRIRRP